MFKMAIVSVAAAVVGIHSAGFFVGGEEKKSFIARVVFVKRWLGAIGSVPTHGSIKCSIVGHTSPI